MLGSRLPRRNVRAKPGPPQIQTIPASASSRVLKDAGQAARNLELVSSLPKPVGFFDPKRPAGEPTGPETEEKPDPKPGEKPEAKPSENKEAKAERKQRREGD